MNNESTLSKTTDFLIFFILITVVSVVHSRVLRLWLADDLEWRQLALIANGNDTPVIEATLPELAEVYVNLSLHIILRQDIARLNLVPSQKMGIVSLNLRR